MQIAQFTLLCKDSPKKKVVNTFERLCLNRAWESWKLYLCELFFAQFVSEQYIGIIKLLAHTLQSLDQSCCRGKAVQKYILSIFQSGALQYSSAFAVVYSSTLLVMGLLPIICWTIFQSLLSAPIHSGRQAGLTTQFNWEGAPVWKACAHTTMNRNSLKLAMKLVLWYLLKISCTKSLLPIFFVFWRPVYRLGFQTPLINWS